MVKAKSALLDAMKAYGGVASLILNLGNRWWLVATLPRGEEPTDVGLKHWFIGKYVEHYQAIFIDVTTGGPQVTWQFVQCVIYELCYCVGIRRAVYVDVCNGCVSGSLKFSICEYDFSWCLC